MNMTVTVPEGLIEALQHQGQCDEDGTNCIVSREAVDAAIGILQAVPQLEHERDKALKGYERAMHCIAQLEALPLLQFTSVDDELPDQDGEYLCQFDDGKVETYSYRIDDGGFHADDVEPGFRVVGWCDLYALPGSACAIAHLRHKTLDEMLVELRDNAPKDLDTDTWNWMFRRIRDRSGSYHNQYKTENLQSGGNEVSNE